MGVVNDNVESHDWGIVSRVYHPGKPPGGRIPNCNPGFGNGPPTGCGHSHDDEHEHPEAVVTQPNDSTELLLEYPHLLAGEVTGSWAVHLTDMKTFRPTTSGAPTVRFLQGSREVRRFTLDAPRPGRLAGAGQRAGRPSLLRLGETVIFQELLNP
jgi:hypothetical protein